MEFRCEDIPAHGVVLVPPSSADYPALAADIERRAANPIPGAPPPMPFPQDPDEPAMVLINRAKTGIAAVSWIWKSETETGAATSSSVSIGQLPPALAPFNLDDRSRKLYGYWHVILPGSKRLIHGNRMLGDNTDVRSPQPEELWTGGGMGGGGGSRHGNGPVKSITLALDGVFFMDGGFAGPDTLRHFDRLTADAAAHVEIGKLARAGHNQGLAPAEIFARIEAVTGPDRGPARPTSWRGPNPDFRAIALQNLAWLIGGMKRSPAAAEHGIYQLMSWTEAPLPPFHKL